MSRVLWPGGHGRPSRVMRSTRLVCGAVLAILLAAPVARAGDATGAQAPYEDVTEVLATLAWHLDDDLYRYPRAKDPTGRDVFRLSLERLEAWETRFPTRLRDVTTFGRAQCLERLGEYQRATTAYGQVAAMPGSPLAAKAREQQARAKSFADTLAMTDDGPDMQARLAALQKKLDAWNVLIQANAGTPYENIGRVEEERLEVKAANLVVEHRHGIERGDETADRALRFIVEKHAESKNLPAHVLALGALQEAVARDWFSFHDRPLTFDEDAFILQTDRALDTYRKVATWDGAPEKPEGQGRFQALESWKTMILARFR